MRDRSLAFFLIIVSTLLNQQIALADGLAFSRNARTFETQQSSLITKGLAHACLTMFVINDSLPCNPANVPFNKNPGLTIQGLLSNGYSTLEKTQRLLKGDTSPDFLNSLFAGQNVLQIEGNAELNFVSSYLNARWTPDSVRMFTVVRNEANPSVEIYAVEEKGFTFQSGLETFKGLYLGLQARVLERKFVRKNFQLVSLATQQGRDALQPKIQKVLYFEPGLTWVIEPTWKPRISTMVMNWGSVSQQYDELPVPTEVQYGIGVSPPIGWGTLDLMLDYRSMSYQEPTEEKFHAGAQYQFGAMSIFGGIDYNGMSAGLFYNIEKINAGIMFSTTELPGKDDDYYAQTVYAELGWQL